MQAVIPPGERPASRWLSWLIGIAVLGAVIMVCLRISDIYAFAQVLQRTQWSWLLLAALAQTITYFSEAFVWRGALRPAGELLPLTTALQLSAAKLFVDQAVPTGGLSGTLVYVQGLRRTGTSQRAAISGMIVDAASFYAAYALCVAAALVVAVAIDNINGTVAAIAVAFMILSSGFAVAVLLQFGHWSGPLSRRLEHFALTRHMLELMRAVDPRIARSPRVLLPAIGWQATIQLLDALSVWLLLQALGWSATLPAVFTAYMFAALFRTISISPAGLGTFEAASVLLLRATGMPIEFALSATLLFRLLNFWLPMLPGLWAARRVLQARGPFSGQPSD